MDKNDPVVQEFIGYWRLSDLGMDLSHRVFFDARAGEEGIYSKTGRWMTEAKLMENFENSLAKD
jgi:hypothetical protein